MIIVSRALIAPLSGCLVVIAALFVPGTAGAQSGDVSGERSTAIEIESTAQVGGSRLGRIPKCPTNPERGLSRPLNKREKGKRNRVFRCWDKQGAGANQVAFEFLEAVQRGDGALACELVTPAERERLGNLACPQRVQDAARGLAGREFESSSAFIGVGKHPSAEYFILVTNPREAVLVELDVVNRHWRVSNARELIP